MYVCYFIGLLEAVANVGWSLEGICAASRLSIRLTLKFMHLEQSTFKGILFDLLVVGTLKITVQRSRPVYNFAEDHFIEAPVADKL